jgi:hypothetical protein
MTYQKRQTFPNTRLPALGWQSSRSADGGASQAVEELLRALDHDRGLDDMRLWRCRTIYRQLRSIVER